MHKRAWELLPLSNPSSFDPSEKEPDYFYKNFIQPMIKDIIRLTATGINIDQDAVEELRTTVLDVLDSVDKKLSNNPIIKKFREHQYKIKYKEYLKEMESKKKTIDDFIKPYKPDNIVHRTYVVNMILQLEHLKKYKLNKWTVNDIKKLLQIEYVELLQNIIDKKDLPIDILDLAMCNLAKDKMVIYNKSHYEDKIASKTFDDIVPKFNAGSSNQKAELLTNFLNYEPLSLTEGGAPQWNRKNLEMILYTVKDKNIKEIIQCLIDYSFSAIIQDNFINAFDKFTVDNVLYGNIKLFGAKSYRPTSNNPNLLNQPSTGSVYAKPLKKCFVPPTGYLLWTIDYAALEDRVIANLSGDGNKLSVFTENIDGHSLGATYYFPDRVKALIGEYTDNKVAAKALRKLVDEDNLDAESVRQDGKPVTFGLSYGAFPPKVATSIGCSLEEATSIFNAYHEEMYPDITAMREEAMKVAKTQGYLHLGLGCRMYSDDIDKDTRTLFNGLSQFWSILTLIAMNELNYRIDRDDMDIHINATIYDALYGYVKADVESVKWLNDTLCPIMEKDFMEGQIVHNEANLEISSTNWAEFTELTHDMNLDEIQEVINEIHS